MSGEAEIRSSLKDDDMLLKMYVMPAGRLGEGDFLKFCYPEKDHVVYGVHAVLHSLRDLLAEKMGMVVESVEMSRGGRRMVCIFRVVDGCLVCLLWTVGEVSGGMVPPRVGDVSSGPGGLEINGAKVTKMSLDVTTMVVTVGQESWCIKRPDAARLERFANVFPGKVKHNIRQRAVVQTKEFLTTATDTILATITSLWTSIPDACSSPTELTSLLTDISRYFTTHHNPVTCPTSCFAPLLQTQCLSALHAIPPPPRHPTDPLQTAIPKYTPTGELIIFKNAVVATTLPLAVVQVVVLYLQGVQFMHPTKPEDILVDCLILEGGAKGLLNAYLSEGLLAVAVLRPSKIRGLGVTQEETVSQLKSTLENLRNKGFFHPTEPLMTVQTPLGVYRYTLTARSGLVTITHGSEADGYIDSTFAAVSGHVASQLQTARYYQISFETPKPRRALTMTGWAHDNTDTLVVLHDADVHVSLPGLYCKLVAGMPL
eukprot:TRINITY_DN48410_c0_g1_i1.p1 TRINITY_DN48410_c0_g1~~TRINITY_DN48410_c0_g1_i1.p1  ORF type:complete len:497 (+),score=68.95 TRINITY_DN48410_c0_g1_i1:39-1493(+)